MVAQKNFLHLIIQPVVDDNSITTYIEKYGFYTIKLFDKEILFFLPCKRLKPITTGHTGHTKLIHSTVFGSHFDDRDGQLERAGQAGHGAEDGFSCLVNHGEVRQGY